MHQHRRLQLMLTLCVVLCRRCLGSSMAPRGERMFSGAKCLASMGCHGKDHRSKFFIYVYDTVIRCPEKIIVVIPISSCHRGWCCDGILFAQDW